MAGRSKAQAHRARDRLYKNTRDLRLAHLTFPKDKTYLPRPVVEEEKKPKPIVKCDCNCFCSRNGANCTGDCCFCN